MYRQTLIPDGVTTIADEAFNGCGTRQSITIPNSVTRIESYAFLGNNIKNAYVYTIEPPFIANDIFSSKPTIHVFAEAIDAYLASDWNKYYKIEGDLADILYRESIEKGDASNEEIFDLYGNKSDSSGSGKILIKNGKKVMVK